MKTLLLISFFYLTCFKVLSHTFSNFLIEVNKIKKDELYQYDFHIDKIGLQNFQELFLSELAKEMFSSNIYQRQKKPIIEKKLFLQQKNSILEKSKKLPIDHQYVINLLISDIQEVISSKQYSSIIRYNSGPSYRLNKKVRSNLKKIHLLSKWWLFLQESEKTKINDVFKNIINATSKRCLKMSQLVYSAPKDYKLKYLIKKNDKPKSVKTSKDILENIEIDPKEQKKTEVTKTKEWVPKNEPSFLKLLDKFLNSKNQAKFKNQRYAAPQNMPKPANDW